MKAVLVVILVASAVTAFAVGRWWTVLLPIVSFGLFYAGLNAEWWGSGVGDGWQYAMAFLMAIGAFAAGVGVLARTLVRPRAERPAPD